MNDARDSTTAFLQKRKRYGKQWPKNPSQSHRNSGALSKHVRCSDTQLLTDSSDKMALMRNKVVALRKDCYEAFGFPFIGVVFTPDGDSAEPTATVLV